MNNDIETISFFDSSKNEMIHKNNGEYDSKAPLAQRLKPCKLEEFVGQEHILSKDKLLYRAIKGDRLTSLILYGPPGVGKTSLAKIIATTTKCTYYELNAVTSGVKDIKDIIDKANNNMMMYNQRTILFIDEIHRFNKSQQDALLPHVEKGTVILIGATTENPFFEVNRALLSRSMIFKLNILEDVHIKALINRALTDKDKGYGHIKINLTKEALEFICINSNGDGRRALNALELAVLTTNKDKDGIIQIPIEVIEECIQKRNVSYDKSGDNHYDIISAFIKSMRGSDPDAAIHYLARMLYAGEDPEFIARRVIIAASEDVGNADPYALLLAHAALDAVKNIGMPEARITLAQAVIYISTAPKSNACYNAINSALADVEKGTIGEVPTHLKDKSYSGAKVLNNGPEYKYPHDYKNHYVSQQYLPKELISKVYYEPTTIGYEKKVKERLDYLGKINL